MHLTGTLKILNLEIWIAFIAACVSAPFQELLADVAELLNSVIPCPVVKGQD